MKKILIVLISLLVLTGGGYLFHNWYKNKNIATWSFIPSDALLVYQPTNLSDFWLENEDKPIWKNLVSLPFINNAKEQFALLDSLSESNSFLDNREVLLSAHLTSKNSLDFLAVFSFDENNDKTDLNQMLDYSKSQNFKTSTRQYLGYDINVLSKDDLQLSYFIYKNFVIGSFTSFLVEDAIRVFDDADYLNFKDQNFELFGLSKIENDQGDIYVNSNNLDALVGMFTDPINTNISALSKLTHLSFLDLAINNESLVFSGFSLNSAVKGNYLDAFDGVESSTFLMHAVVPRNASTFFHISFDNAEKWHSNLKNFWRKNSPELLTNMGEMENKYEFPLNDLYDFLGHEVGILDIESNALNKDLVAIIHTTDVEQGYEYFNNLSAVANTEDDVYSNQYRDYEIRQISIDEVPMRFFGPLFSGFESTYYTIENDYIMMANSEFVMKDLIDNLKDENTWSKSIKMNEFLDIANKESNLSLYINTKSALNQIASKLNEKWRPIIEDNKPILNKLEYGVAQFSNIDGKFYTNIVLKHSDNVKVNKTNSARINIGEKTTFNKTLITKPVGVRNHNDNALEFVVQDADYNFHLLSSKFDQLWSTSLSDKIVGEIYQLDYYKNNKLQYAFATEKQIHIIDRLGNYIPGYPLKIPQNETIKFLSLLDYNGSKTYRLLVATPNGKYFMFDKSGKNLDGWNPKILGNEPSTKAIHLRVRNSDVLLLAHKNGTIELLNRRSETKNGFPLVLDSNIDKTYFINKGASLSSTYITVVTEEGELIKFDLDGKIKEQITLFRNNTNDRFSITKSSDGRNYKILRKESNQISVLNAKGEELFVHPYPLENFSSQFYYFNNNHQVFVLTDKDQEFTYLYDKEGKLINGQPISTGNQIAMLYQSTSNNYKIFLTYGEHFSVMNLNR